MNQKTKAKLVLRKFRKWETNLFQSLLFFETISSFPLWTFLYIYIYVILKNAHTMPFYTEEFKTQAQSIWRFFMNTCSLLTWNSWMKSNRQIADPSRPGRGEGSIPVLSRTMCVVLPAESILDLLTYIRNHSLVFKSARGCKT